MGNLSLKTLIYTLSSSVYFFLGNEVTESVRDFSFEIGEFSYWSSGLIFMIDYSPPF